MKSLRRIASRVQRNGYCIIRNQEHLFLIMRYTGQATVAAYRSSGTSSLVRTRRSAVNWPGSFVKITPQIPGAIPLAVTKITEDWLVNELLREVAILREDVVNLRDRFDPPISGRQT
jgi:hypothetical protein